MRVSTLDQNPETQLHDLHQMAAQRGYAIVQEYTDRISGAKAKRPGLDQMMADARRCRFDVVLVWASDRIARSVKHFLDVLDELNRIGVEYVILRDRIVVDERVYDNEFDEVKTAAGKREVPYDKYGVILGAVRQMWTRNKNFRLPDDLVFANRAGKALDRHNLLHRHVKPVAGGLGLPKTIDFRSFRTMHASLMRRFGARLEVARDNMGHAGSSGSITLDVYSKTWWDERVEAVNRIVEAVFAEPDQEEKKRIVNPLKGLPDGGMDKQWEPFWELQAV
jgi:hypothetical protein